ncbi:MULTISPECIES: nucleoside phosphorylase [Jonquetella]|uniref:Uridine phosphorylase n=1 Tax=Jonquetella anthropi DSM 22815 TaxID=885272 RepID=H0UIZ4_9BACT|nr:MULTISPECIES: nucleoside phosphorylase [Jonquetella]EEX49374.1 putative uridine phosphorylase [Jonquetella anthropi E3_33 E1]EHM13821.1 uridine phosphorylase [Jonquetella anthropi DSM 22815]ERL24235.1 putative uridine phosphorylase [Jonquetella sp. BV3C21]
MSWKSDSERPEQEGCQFHIRVKPGDAAPYAVLPGDPARTDLIAQGWDDARLVANNREHRTFTGTLRGVPVTACSTGVGGPSASNAIEELARLGTHTFIRVGTCGALRAEIQPGDLIVNCAAIRHDGTSDLYAPAAYPAAASYDVTAALIEACDRLGYRCHVGVTCSTASFYAGQARPGFGGFKTSSTEHLISDLTAMGVLNFEMEAATLFTLCSLFGLRSGCVCTAIANRVTGQLIETGIEKSVAAANEALLILAGRDEICRRENKPYWHGGLR